ncbi:S8 family serine peptidase [Streptomyces sp. URMC 129]|uniref:S8 family peptidase n=1 Tax=Streptomyces sp. URMC 129 TaxID=3423407 RepID=UPI003F1DBF45
MVRKRRRGARLGAVVVCVAVGAGFAAPVAGGQEPSPGGGGTEETAGASRLVTLITGDRVVVDDQGEVRGLIRAEGREDVPVQVSRNGEHVEVVPQDVVPMLRDGTLDRRLFDITELSRDGYAADTGLPLIVTYEDEGLSTESRRGGGDATTLGAINAEALTVGAGDLPALWDDLTSGSGGSGERAGTPAAAPGIESIALDGLVEASLDESVPQIGAPEAWEAGYDGEGVTIAVLDTGISEDHPDLAGQVIATENFSDADDAGDRVGHGTHVASIAAGTGAASGGTYTGVAPGAGLLNGKVLNDEGIGYESWIVAGMEWAVEQGADVVNLSIGGPVEQVDPVADALDALSAASDTLFVVAAGNEGPDPGTISSPGTAASALTVGAVDKSDAPAEFSSVGAPGTGAVKPDVTAPGVDIGAAAAPGSDVEEEAEPVADGYASLSGTSMAAPHTAGAAALLAQAHPDWTGEQLKSALTASAQPGEGYSAYQQGAGRVDVAAALDQTVVTEPGVLDFGTAAWPHEDDEPLTRELTYRNLGERDVTLTLTAGGTGPDGSPAPEGTFTLGATEVTVPAGGTATVDVTADTSGGGDLFGTYTAHITATETGDGGQRVVTPAVVEHEKEMYDLTLQVIGRDGEPAPYWQAFANELVGGFGDEPTVHGDGRGTRTLRLAPGDYLLDTTVFHGGTTAENATGVDWLVHPLVSLTENTTLTLDARDAARIDMTVEDSRAELTDQSVGYEMQEIDSPWGYYSYWMMPDLADGFRTAQLGTDGAGWEMSYSVAAATWQRSGREYHTAEVLEGELFHGLDHHVRQEDLARITTGAGTSVEGATGTLATYPDAQFRMLFAADEHALPRTVEVYADTRAGTYSQEFWQFDDQGNQVTSAVSLGNAYEAGERYRETFNTGVFGPLLDDWGGLAREGDALYGAIFPFSDGDGHRAYAAYDSGSTTLYRDGEEYATYDVPLDEAYLLVPPEEAAYELVTEVSRGEPLASVSTKVTASFTFTSATVPEEQEVAELPLSIARFTPELALDSTAPAGRAMRIPVTVQGSAAGDNLGSLAVSVSCDGGETWQDAPVRDGRVKVTSPAAGGTVSLRAEIADKQGNTSTITIVDAYRTAG